jgi:hypothetical protein
MDATAAKKVVSPSSTSRLLLDAYKSYAALEISRQLFNSSGLDGPSALSAKIVTWGSFLLGMYSTDYKRESLIIPWSVFASTNF